MGATSCDLNTKYSLFDTYKRLERGFFAIPVKDKDNIIFQGAQPGLEKPQAFFEFLRRKKQGWALVLKSDSFQGLKGDLKQWPQFFQMLGVRKIEWLYLLKHRGDNQIS